MITSPNDYKQYRHITLPNGLAVLLIQDDQCKKSAASMSVAVGHFDDPQQHEGLAHLLEHMLFLGTDKYPKPGEYQSFISMHGGSNNAWTGTEYTNYYFDINNSYFHNALDRFAQFFIAPSFNADLLDRERHAVDSEFKLKLKDDVRRFYQVHKETVNPTHPFSKFSVGNLSTLADTETDTLREELLRFYEQHYCASLMKLVIQSELSLDKQEHMLNEMFSAIPNRGINAVPLATPLYTDAQLQQAIWVESISGHKKLYICFPLGNIVPYYQIKPLSHISQLLGDETESSLLSLLKRKGWVTALSAGSGQSGANFKDYNVIMGLTSDGFKHITEIVEFCLQYIKLIAEQGLQAWRYDEKKNFLEQAFRYQEKIPAIKNVSHLSQNLHIYQLEHVIYGDYMMTGFDIEACRFFLQQFNATNMRLMVSAPNLDTNKTAAWYDTPYRVEAFTTCQLQRWANVEIDESLALPIKNRFMSSSLEALALDKTNLTEQPTLIAQSEGFKTWFMQEHEFHLPKGNIFISIDSEYAIANTHNIAMTRLAVELLMEQLNSLTYQAEIAGINYHIYAHQGGFTLHIAGFAQKQFELLKLIIGHRHLQMVDSETFSSIRNQLLISWENQKQAKPINRLFSTLTSVLQPNNPSSERLAKALMSIKQEQLPEYLEKVYQNISVEVLVHGDWHQSQALEISQYVKDKLHPFSSPGKETIRKLVDIRNTGSLVHEIAVEHNDAALIIYYQSPKISPKELAYYSLANHVMSSKFFYELRTQQQLGYVVGTGNIPLNRHAGLMFYVQSPHTPPIKLLDAINDFIDFFPFGMISFTEQQWQSSKQGLISKLHEPDANINSKSKRLWHAIGIKDKTFNKSERIAEELEKIERVDLIRFMVELKSRTADRLIMSTISQVNKQDDEYEEAHVEKLEGTYIADVEAFQQQRNVFEL
ncbi:Protease III precursor [Moritella sp. JT01]|uniref:insulinase family protein n=1 Tax=Moritella sp. JT01 TaxID=756698 RepID=UPI0007966596|nr:insulinase family protein [Moritella sp. JT01]KXO07123.1 Protease III precursor [Moritella sp. JT01]